MATIFFARQGELSGSWIETWNKLLKNSDNRLTAFQSPEWVSHLVEVAGKNEVRIALIGNGNGGVDAIVPMTFGSSKIKFDLKARVFFSVPVKTICLLGSIPLIPHSNKLYDLFFRNLFQVSPDSDGVYLDSVPVESFLWQYLLTSPLIKERFIVHIPDGTRKHFSLILPPSFHDYLAGFKKKKRAELRRRLKIFHENNGNDKALVRVDKVGQVQMFLQLASAVSKKSWQHRVLGPRLTLTDDFNHRLTRLAEKKMLRAYLLFFRGKPCAFRLGYQYGDRYVSAETGYDQSFSDISPGKILTLLMIEDLTAYKPPNMVDFGIGYAEWKKDLCNTCSEDASVFLLRKNMRNKLISISHSGFCTTVRFARRYMKGGAE